MSRRRTRDLARAALAALSLALPACSMGAFVDVAMTLAKRPSIPEPRAVLGYELLAGDFHCHVSPPDSPGHVSRGVAETLELADAEALDFVVLTPHVRARFFQHDDARREVLGEREATMREVRAALAERATTRPGARPLLVLPGMEYTDFADGHLGLSFGDLEATLARVSADEATESPERFFEAFVATGGVVTINHPFLTPVDSPLAITRRDLSFRPWTTPGAEVAPEIARAAGLAQAVEAHNLAMSELRDKLLLGDATSSLFETLGGLEDHARAGRRLTPVGGTDSHGSHLRATTFALADARTAAGLREAVLRGRTCVRSPAACAFEARGEGGAFYVVGSSVRANGKLEVRAWAASGEVVVDGRVAAWARRGEITTVEVPVGRCSLVRLDADGGASAPIYVNCPFADEVAGAR